MVGYIYYKNNNIQMKPIMIIESNNNPLSLSEEFVTSTGKKACILGGPFTEFDIKNRNERIYTAPKFLPCLEEMNSRMTNMIVYGEFDHPDVFDTSLSRASHVVKEAVYNKELNRIDGKIQLLSTFWGKEARAIVEDSLPIFVSSRAAGVTENDGTVTLKKLFTYDIVADPGFASAKMGFINESLKLPTNANYRIYEMSDESKINDLFNMNNNDFVTKEQLSTYSNYLIKEIETIKKNVNEAVKKGNMDPKKLEGLLEYQDALDHTNSQMVKYLDYLAETVQIVVNDNKNLREVSEKLISYSDYLSENLDKNIAYSEYLAENMDRTIEYTEYIAENLDKSIAYGEYIAEQLDKSIAYGEYIAEHLDKSIAYSEYLAEHVEGNIAYSEYIAEHLDDNIAYSEYIAENLDKSISYSGLISERLNGTKVNEDTSSTAIPTLEEWGFEIDDETEVEEVPTETEATTEATTEVPTETVNIDPITGEIIPSIPTEEVPVVAAEIAVEVATEEAPIVADTTEVVPTEEAPIVTDAEIALDAAEVAIDAAEIAVTTPTEEAPIVEPTFTGESDTELSLQIDNLIKEAKKRKVTDTSDLHFLKFLNKSQVDGYYNLTNEEQEMVKLHINEKSYFNGADVLKLIQEALSVRNETLEEKIVRLIPEAVKPVWDGLSEISKKSVLSQAKLGYDLTNEAAIENFWYTRNLKKNETSKKMISHDSLIQEDKLSDSQVNSILERINCLK